MAVSIPAGFLVINTEPIEGRMLVADAAARKNTSTYDQYKFYHGLLVYEQDTNKLFALKDPTNVTSDSSWEELSGGSGTPGGADTQIQFNNSDAFAGSPKFIFNSTTGAANISGSFSISGSTASDIFLVKSGSLDVAKITTDGVFVLGELNPQPTAVEGGIFYSSSALYVGVV